jgi:hypothetical protein
VIIRQPDALSSACLPMAEQPSLEKRKRQLKNKPSTALVLLVIRSYLVV